MGKRFPKWLHHRCMNVGLLAVLCLSLQAAPGSQVAVTRNDGDELHRISRVLEALSRRVSPSVVKIMVTGYGPVGNSEQQDVVVVTKKRAIGSGVIIDPDGYIITNAHVISGAQRVRVILTPGRDRDTTQNPRDAAPPRILNARILGADKDIDLAVLKVEANNLPTLPIGSYRQVRQGQVVLAFGSPEGLDNTVTMGLVSSVARQLDPDQPFVYIQTDAAINPGNSGGPLVDADGNLVGLNTFILSESGGSEGIGFAIPSGIVHFVYEQIRRYGHVHRKTIGAALQTVTPELAAGLMLKQNFGVIVADITPGGPAAQADLHIQDVILRMDDVPIETLPRFEAALYLRPDDRPAKLEVLRGDQKIVLDVPVIVRQDQYDSLLDLAKPESNLVRELGILGLTVDPKVEKMLPELRVNTGVVVLARSEGAPIDIELLTGDVIHSLNGQTIATLEGLRAAISRLKAGDAVAMQIERQGELMYIAFDLD